MKKNKIINKLCILVFLISFVYASENHIKQKHDKLLKTHISSELVMSVPVDNIINGLVITSCGMCNLGTNDKGCSLSVKIGNKIYSVKGTKINEHGDEHGKVGFCNAVRVAWAKGEIIKDVFHAEYFTLVGH